MSNIDKQALRLTAEKAKDNFMPNFMVPTRDVLALLDELEAAEYTAAVRLEALDNRISELNTMRYRIKTLNGTVDIVDGQRDRWMERCKDAEAKLEAAEKRNAEMSESNRLLCADSMIKQDRIAELEARKVKIKLPESFYPDGDIDCPLVINEYQIIEAIVAADCKPIAVCPRCKCELDLSHKPDGAHFCHPDAAGKGE